MDEVWKEIPGVPQYEASTLGRIRSLRVGKGTRGAGHIMRHCRGTKGYRLVRCRVGSDSILFKVHRLVAAAFYGAIPKGHQVNHKNGIKDDNRSENLEICTPSQNQIHRTAVLGVKMRWYRSPGAMKLSETDIRRIRAEVAEGRLFVDVAKDYGVSANCISNIAKRKRWAHVV